MSSIVQLRPRRRGFAKEALRVGAYQCAMCGFDGALGHYPVAIRLMCAGKSHQGTDEMANTLARCALHHALFDLGVLGLTEDRRIRVSSPYVARNKSGQVVRHWAKQMRRRRLRLRSGRWLCTSRSASSSKSYSASSVRH